MNSSLDKDPAATLCVTVRIKWFLLWKRGKCQHWGGDATNHLKCQTILIAQHFSEQERRQKLETKNKHQRENSYQIQVGLAPIFKSVDECFMPGSVLSAIEGKGI